MTPRVPEALYHVASGNNAKDVGQVYGQARHRSSVKPFPSLLFLLLPQLRISPTPALPCTHTQQLPWAFMHTPLLQGQSSLGTDARK